MSVVLHLPPEDIGFETRLQQDLLVLQRGTPVLIQKSFRFPLAEINTSYYNHTESLVRTSAMNSIFTLIKINGKGLIRYFSLFPFSLFYLNLVCFVRSKWI